MKKIYQAPSLVRRESLGKIVATMIIISGILPDV